MAIFLHELLVVVLESYFAMVSESERQQVSKDLERQLKALGYIEEE